MEYTVDYFINKFEKIPEDKWITGMIGLNSIENSPKCALGHCGIDESFLNETKDSKALKEIFSNTSFTSSISPIRGGTDCIWKINDGYIKEYQQETPKQRILAALYDIKKSQEIKEKIVYKTVQVDSQIKKLVKEELQLN